MKCLNKQINSVLYKVMENIMWAELIALFPVFFWLALFLFRVPNVSMLLFLVFGKASPYIYLLFSFIFPCAIWITIFRIICFILVYTKRRFGVNTQSLR